MSTRTSTTTGQHIVRVASPPPLVAVLHFVRFLNTTEPIDCPCERSKSEDVCFLLDRWVMTEVGSLEKVKEKNQNKKTHMKNQQSAYQLLLSPLAFSFHFITQKHQFNISSPFHFLHLPLTHPNTQRRMLHMEQDRDTGPAAVATITPTPTTGQQGQEGLSLQSGPMRSKVPLGTYVYASAPARIDLAGGWTDAIPIT